MFVKRNQTCLLLLALVSIIIVFVFTLSNSFHLLESALLQSDEVEQQQKTTKIVKKTSHKSTGTQKSKPKFTIKHHAQIMNLTQRKQQQNENNLTAFCRNPVNCYRAECYAPEGYHKGGCLPNPYFKPLEEPEPDFFTNPINKKTYPSFEANCVEESPLRRDDERKEKLMSIDESKDLKTDFEKRLHNFKKHTNWMFNKWYDFLPTTSQESAEKFCKTPSSKSENFELRGFHEMESTDGLYRLQNVCLRPMGKMAGFVSEENRKEDPKKNHKILKEYRSTDDCYFVNHVPEPGFEDFVRDFDILEKPAECYLDIPLILFPISQRNSNFGHAMMRAGSLMRLIEEVQKQKRSKKKDGRLLQHKNITIGYIASFKGEPSTATKENLIHDNAFNKFYELFSKDTAGWFSTYANNWTQTWENREEIYGFLPKDEDLQKNSLLCFKEAILWGNAYAPKSKLMYGGTNGAGLSDKANSKIVTSFHLHGNRGRRDIETWALLDEKIRSCLFPPNHSNRHRRTRAKHTKQHVIFVVRSKWRRFTFQPYISDYLGRRLAERDFTFEVLEHSHIPTFRELVSRFSNADAVVGMYGASLMLSFFLPVGGVLIQANTRRFTHDETSGINPTPSSDFGGTSLVAQHAGHVVLADTRLLQRFVTGMPHPHFAGGIDLNILPDPFFKFAINKMECLFKKVNIDRLLELNEKASRMHTLTGQGAGQEQCEFTNGDYVSLANTQMSSVHRSLEQIQQAASMKLFEKSSSPFFSPRLEAMLLSLQKTTTQRATTNENAKQQQKEGIDLLTQALHPLISPSDGGNLAQVVSNLQAAEVIMKEMTTNVLFVEPCEGRAQIYAEASFLRQLIMRIDRFHVMEWAAGQEFCQKQQQQKEKFSVMRENIWSEGIMKNFLEKDPIQQIPVQFQFCDYPCSRELDKHRFHLIIHECFEQDEQNCIVEDSSQRGFKSKFHNDGATNRSSMIPASSLFGLYGIPWETAVIGFSAEKKTMFVSSKKSRESTKIQKNRE